MFSQARSKALFCLVAVSMLIQASPSLAEEAKKEVEEERASSPEIVEVDDVQKKQLSEAQDLQTKVQALRARIKSKEDSINKLIQEKNQVKNADRVSDILKEMVAEHKELSKMIVEYEQIRSLLRYRYPEKGYTGNRAYERMEVKPLDQMENQMSIEAKLKRNLSTVRSQYGGGSNPSLKNKKTENKKETSTPSLTEPIILQK